jgi:tetratricopeptide (TPR) repeat protein
LAKEGRKGLSVARSFLLSFAFFVIFVLGALGGFLFFRESAERGLAWATSDTDWLISQNIANERYDAAIKLALRQVHDETTDYSRYHVVGSVYFARARRDEVHRDVWVKQALSYSDRALSLGPGDASNLYDVAIDYERGGDLAKDGCDYYQKAIAACQNGMYLVKGDTVKVGAEDEPAKPLRTDFQGLMQRLKAKVAACPGLLRPS